MSFFRWDTKSAWLRILLVAVGYFLLARIGLSFAIPPEKKATAIWPPSGLAVAAVYLWGARAGAGVWLGAFAANFSDYWLGANPHTAALNAFVSAAIATGSTLQALLAGRWLAATNQNPPLATVGKTFRFLRINTVACLVAASFGSFSLLAAGFVPLASLGTLWGTWWLGDCTGMLVVGSLLLSWIRPDSYSGKFPTGYPGLPLIAGLMVPATAAFGVLERVTLPPPIAYLVLPVLIWSTFAYGLRGATSSLGFVSLLAVAGAASGRGPFVQPTVFGSLALLQVYLAVVGATVLTMAAVLSENARAQATLREYNQALAKDVATSTEALELSEHRFKAIFHSQFQFIGLMDVSGVVLEANRTALGAAGVAESEVIGRPFWETAWWTHDREQQLRLQQAVETAAQGKQDRFEASHPYPGGGLLWVDFSLTPFHDSLGNVIFLIPEGRDITDKKRAEESLRVQEQYMRGAFQHAPIGLALVSPEGRWLKVNDSLCKLVGYSEEELLQIDFQTITHPEDLNADLEFVRKVLNGQLQSYQMEKRYFHKDGHTIHILLAVSLVRDSQNAPLYFISHILDITERKRAKEKLQSAVREKELMLKEIHHRVKNNLQVISTLLELQSSHHKDPKITEVFAESRARVRSMALIHERLYRSENLDRVDFENYSRGLIQYLCQTYAMASDEIEVAIQVGWKSLPLDQAVPCGLLLNELISNSFKHAFVDHPSGARLEVELSLADGCRRQLCVRDNGRGLPAGFQPDKAETFGMQLIFTLVEQLKGIVSFGEGPGFEFLVTLPQIL